MMRHLNLKVSDQNEVKVSDQNEVKVSDQNEVKVGYQNEVKVSYGRGLSFPNCHFIRDILSMHQFFAVSE